MGSVKKSTVGYGGGDQFLKQQSLQRQRKLAKRYGFNPPLAVLWSHTWTKVVVFLVSSVLATFAVVRAVPIFREERKVDAYKPRGAYDKPCPAPVRADPPRVRAAPRVGCSLKLDDQRIIDQTKNSRG